MDRGLSAEPTGVHTCTSERRAWRAGAVGRAGGRAPAEIMPAAVFEDRQADHRRVVGQLPQAQAEPEDGPAGQQQRDADAERHVRW